MRLSRRGLLARAGAVGKGAAVAVATAKFLPLAQGAQPATVAAEDTSAAVAAGMPLLGETGPELVSLPAPAPYVAYNLNVDTTALRAAVQQAIRVHINDAWYSIPVHP